MIRPLHCLKHVVQSELTARNIEEIGSSERNSVGGDTQYESDDATVLFCSVLLSCRA